MLGENTNWNIAIVVIDMHRKKNTNDGVKPEAVDDAEGKKKADCKRA